MHRSYCVPYVTMYAELDTNINCKIICIYYMQIKLTLHVDYYAIWSILAQHYYVVQYHLAVIYFHMIVNIISYVSVHLLNRYDH